MAAVLIVEDEPGIREIEDEALTLAGHHCRAVGTAAAAREEVTGILPEVVVLDYLLPDSNGAAFMHWLRTYCAHQQVPMPKVVLVTAVPEYIRIGAATQVDLALNKPDAHLTKPFLYDDLVGAVRRVLAPQHRARGDSGSLRRSEEAPPWHKA